MNAGHVPDVHLLLEVAFTAAVAEASDREEHGEATDRDRELLDYISRERPAGLSVAQSQAAALDRWEQSR